MSHVRRKEQVSDIVALRFLKAVREAEETRRGHAVEIDTVESFECNGTSILRIHWRAAGGSRTVH